MSLITLVKGYITFFKILIDFKKKFQQDLLEHKVMDYYENGNSCVYMNTLK